MGVFGRIKSFFKKEEPKNAQEYYDENFAKPKSEPVIIPKIDTIEKTENGTTFTYTPSHRTADETEVIKAEIQERPPQEPLPQPKPVAEPRIPLHRQTNVRARKLLERRKNLRELSKIRPNGTEVGPDA